MARSDAGFGSLGGTRVAPGCHSNRHRAQRGSVSQSCFAGTSGANARDPQQRNDHLGSGPGGGSGTCESALRTNAACFSPTPRSAWSRSRLPPSPSAAPSSDSLPEARLGNIFPNIAVLIPLRPLPISCRSGQISETTFVFSVLHSCTQTAQDLRAYCHSKRRLLSSLR